MVEESKYFSTKMKCPRCGFCKSWGLRRGSRKCKRCRREWSPTRQLVSGIRAGTKEWRKFLQCFLRYKTTKNIALHVGYSLPTVLAMCQVVRKVMENDLPERFNGIVEVDETYIAGTWYNKRWSTRKHGTKRGRGTTKQAVFGLCGRAKKQVRAWLVPNVLKKTLMPIIKDYVAPGSTIYSDAYQLYQETRHEGYAHDFVDHHQNEYARGKVSTNMMEGFWGILKRRLRSTGGVRRERLCWYVIEECWRYNHLALLEEEKIERLIDLLS